MENTSFINQANKVWKVIYTRSRWEKKVDQMLKEQGIESFCPLVKRMSQWADRKKMVEFPLFNSYIFVKINPREEAVVRQTLGVLNFVYYSGKPATLRDNVIENIQNYLKIYPDIETVSLNNLKIGDKVKIKKGVFSDQQGEVIRVDGKNILMVLEDLDCMLTTKVSIQDLGLVS